MRVSFPKGGEDILGDFWGPFGLREENLRENESELFKDREREARDESLRFDHSSPYVLHFSFILFYFDGHTKLLADVWMLALII